MTKWTLGVILCDLVLAVVSNTSAMLLQLVLPVPATGQAATRFLASSRIRPVFSVFVENLIFVTCISFTMAVVQTPAGNSVVATWLSTYVWLVIIGYATSLVLYAVQNRK